MFVQLLFFAPFAAQCLAQQSNSTSLEGWQFDDNSRSSWDILWTCLTTIFACTWTALHKHVPERTHDKIAARFMYIFAWFGALLAPELMIMYAAIDFHYASAIVKRCNQAFAAKREQSRKEAGPQKEQADAPEDDDTELQSWSLIQGFCIQMDGLQLRTRDDWVYTVSSKNIVSLIEAGMIRPRDLEPDEIEDRAKADAAAKLFAVLQSSWVVVNILARAAYHLPISPIEITTVAYVVCAAFSYGLWWYMPRDMQTRINIHLPYTRDGEDMPGEIRELLDSLERCWHRPGFIKQSKEEKAKLWEQVWPPRRHSLWSRECSDGTLDQLSRAEETALLLWSVLAAHIFCAIHVAAWNFVFPTSAERVAWRVFSLISLGATWGPILVGSIPLALSWLASKYEISAPGLKGYIDPESRRTVLECVIFEGGYVVYGLARMGMLILMLISLRALPAGSFVGIDWMSTVPHI